jgi:hypothetical protein
MGAMRRRRSTWSAWLAVSSALAWSLGAPAHAAPPSPTEAPKIAPDRSLAEALTVEPGATCLDRARLLEGLQSWSDSPRVDLRVAIDVRGSATEAQVLEFQVRVGEDVVVERRFDPAPSRCADLHATVTLAIAIALDDTLATELGIVEAPSPNPEPEPRDDGLEQAEPEADDIPSRPPRELPPRRRSGPPLAITAAGAMFAGVTPRVSAGGLLSFDIRPRDHFDLRLGALVTHLPGFALDSGEVAVTLAAGRFDLCWGTEPMVIRLRLCGGVAGGAAISRGSGFDRNLRQTTPWFAGIAGVDVTLHLVGPLAVELRIEGVFPFQRTHVDVGREGGGLILREPFPVAGLLVALGPRFEF